MIDRRQFLAVTAGAAGAGITTGRAAIAKSPMGDMELVRAILTTLHPGLYRYQSPKAVEQGIRKLERTWSSSPSRETRYLALSAFLATIKCGHSYANFFNQSVAVKKELFDRPTRLPFTFKWVGTQMVVLESAAIDNRLPRGTIITSINDAPTATILRRLLPYVRADGSNDGKRKALLSVTGADGLETFDVFHGLIFGTAKGSSTTQHRIAYRAPGTARDARMDIPALSLADRMARVPQKPKGDQPEWEWTMRDDGLAVLTMDGWGLYNSKWKWEPWLNDRLDSLKGARGLIVDIRENEGGLDCGDAILARLSASDIVRPQMRRLVRYDRVPGQLNPYLDTWDDSFRDWSDSVERYDDRFFIQKKSDDTSIIAQRGPRITVPMVVLTSAQNSSATFQFVQQTRQSGLGRLIGETTGGNLRGINGGRFFFARLPESGLEFDVPLVGTFPVAPMPDAGLRPDIAVSQTAADIATGKDPALDRAVQYMKTL